MKTLVALIPLVVWASLAPLASEPAPPELSDLGWMAGCWERRTGETLAEEQWMRPAGGVMAGMGRTLRGGTAVASELMRIEEREGAVFFVAYPSGQPSAEFRAQSLSRESVVFTNPAHDFPTSVGYRTGAAGDSLHAWIEGGGRRIDYPFGRVACPQRN
jgi:Domain of unknown function (DUF6265)